jgi:TonB family protein
MKVCLISIVLLLAVSVTVQAQVGPARARPIRGATKTLPMMLIEQKPRKVVLAVFVDHEGKVSRTTIVESSGNGIFDERMRGYWKDAPFMPALNPNGQPTADTLRITNTFSVDDRGLASLLKFRNHSDVEGDQSAESAGRIERMRCRDLVWEHDFMQRRARRANLVHEDIFHVAFAMFLASGVNESSRDALIDQWSGLVGQVLAGCREQPEALYWREVFVPIFSRAAPYQSAPVP